MVFSIGGKGAGSGVGDVGAGVVVSCWVASRSLMVSMVRNKGYSLRLVMSNDAKSSGFSFDEMYLSASGWTNVPCSENSFRIDLIASPTKVCQGGVS
jgi:hypothetical protein